MRLRWLPAGGGGVTLLLTLLAQPILARGQLQAGPTLLELGPQTKATRLTLRNSGDTAVAAQVRVYAWSQPDGKDHLVDTDELALSPPILELPAGGEQVVRVIRLGPPARDRDRCYRVVVDELPRAEDGDGHRVRLRMRYVIPVFVRAADASAPAVSCTLEGEGDRLACENRGGRAAQLGATRLLDDAGGTLTLSEGLYGYVLPGSRRIWPLPRERPRWQGPTLRLETRLNGHATMIAVDHAP